MTFFGTGFVLYEHVKVPVLFCFVLFWIGTPASAENRENSGYFSAVAEGPSKGSLNAPLRMRATGQ